MAIIVNAAVIAAPAVCHALRKRAAEEEQKSSTAQQATQNPRLFDKLYPETKDEEE